MNACFFKFQGAGNDFILFDDRNAQFPKDDSELIQKLCDRRFGIGSDGIMLIQHSEEADFYLDFINPDGSRSFCGNGSRCGIRFAELLGMINKQCTFDAIDGMHTAEINDDNVKISMKDVDEIRTEEEGVFLDTGSPHLIFRTRDIDKLDVRSEGRKIRYSNSYLEEGVNVNFVEKLNAHTIKIRTYERGVEDETLSCGTGITAAVLAMAVGSSDLFGEMNVISRGGRLSVGFERSGKGFKNVWLKGPAEKVFSGEVAL